jgi:hypothetical protein
MKIKKKDIYDKLHIDGAVWYAAGEYAPNVEGYNNAKQLQHYIKFDLNKKARIIKRITGYQVYSDDKNAVNLDFR